MKALFIGAGGIATHHLNAMRALGVDVIGIYDVNSERAEALSSEYHISTTDNYYQTAKDADMVYLLTPPSTRLQYIKELSEVCKNIFVEKPLAVSVADAIEMEQIAREKNMICMVGFTQRFRKGYQELRKLIDDGNIGNIIQAFSVRIGPGPGANGQLQESWRTDKKYVCGMTIESLSHDIDFLQSLAGTITEVNGQVKGTVEELPQFDNNSDAVLKYESGAIGSITCSWSSAIAYNMKGVIGTKGAAFLKGDDIWNNTQLIFQPLFGEKEIYSVDDIFQSGEGYLNEDKYFIDCIRNTVNPKCNLTTGREVLQISHRILGNI